MKGGERESERVAEERERESCRGEGKRERDAYCCGLVERANDGFAEWLREEEMTKREKEGGSERRRNDGEGLTAASLSS